MDRTIETMLRRMVHYPWLRPVSVAEPTGAVAVGAVAFEGRLDRALATHPDGRLTVVLDGELFDADAEWRRLGTTGAQWTSRCHAALVGAGWDAEGPAFLARLNGEFSALIWDRVKGELHAVTDRFGLRPLYVATPAGSFAAATELTPLLELPGVDRSWSEMGVSQFFSFGYFFNDDTLLRGVRALPAATCGTFRVAGGDYREQRYWRLRRGLVSGSADDLGAAFEDRFVAAVERRALPGERLGLSLSGGLDARTILGVMPAGRDLQSVSIGIDGSLDHKSATQLAALAGVPHHSFMLEQSFLTEFERHLREMVGLTDGLYLDQGIVMPTMPLYRQLGIEHLMRGHGGELLHMTKAYAFSLDSQALSATAPALEAWLLDHMSSYMLSGVPSDLFRVDLRAGAAASLRRALEACEPADRPVDQVWQLFLDQRIHRETTLSMHTFGCFAGVRQPYLDNDVIDVLFSMPASMKLADELQTRLLRHKRPSFLNVTNSNTGARMGAGTIENTLARIRLKVGAKLGWKGYQPYERLGLWLRRELREFVQSVLSRPAFLESGLFNPDAVRRVVDQHLADQANHTFLLMSLIIFALGQEARDAR
ncbi:MAG: asparagine synthase-related protein [Vicinamibacterales bacterium]